MNTEEIDTQPGLASVVGTTPSSPPQQLPIPETISSPRTTVHEENEKSVKTNDVSDKSK